MEYPQEQRVEEKVVVGTGCNSPPNECTVVQEFRLIIFITVNTTLTYPILDARCNKSCLLSIYFLAL